MSTFVPVVIVEGRTLEVISCAGSEQLARRACARLAKSYREVRLTSHPVGKVDRAECLATWKDGRRIA